MTATLTTLRDRVEATLQDSGNTRWATTDLDEAIQKALDAYSRVAPRKVIDTLTLASAGREVDISTLTTRLRVTRAWWPYTATNPEYPPNWVTFEEWPGDILFLDVDSEPTADDVVRVFYDALHTLNGLNDATETTFPDDAESPLVTGAAGYAAQQRANELAEKLNVDGFVTKRLDQFSTDKLAEFRAFLDQVARRLAAEASGVVPAPGLDRWDARDDTTW